MFIYVNAFITANGKSIDEVRAFEEQKRSRKTKRSRYFFYETNLQKISEMENSGD